jgi:hypothetical protein
LLFYIISINKEKVTDLLCNIFESRMSKFRIVYQIEFISKKFVEENLIFSKIDRLTPTKSKLLNFKSKITKILNASRKRLKLKKIAQM